ncbi:hypothetical protein Nepgr_018194 [Nepenthes gracilis]|uniref:FAD-binding domain-containing protein n=1 Tax=Nepenthes gracilis TaxID=150966 RepID=A0AAD3SQU8_NEPGR|nr:hypothetical protein Nepgr_018194 [Nepenthes gracilis]
MEMKEANIVIVGGGIAGLATAVGLHRLGLKSLVLESSPCLRVTGAAFTTWTNAWHALDALGVGDTLRGEHLRLEGLVAMSAILGVPTAQIAYIDKEAGVEHEVRCLKRKFVLETLANELPKGTIRFSSKVVCIEDSGYLKILHLADGTTLAAKVLIGCDGVNSIVARWLGFQKPSIDERSCIRGYVAFEESHGFEPKFLQFIAGGIRYGIIPCDDKSIYWFFGFPSSWQDNEVTEDPIKMKQFVLSNLGKVPDKIKNVIQETKLEDLSCAQFRYRVPWEMLLKNISKDNVCTAGDAFHPMTPDLGQGACSALEDGIVLARCLAQALKNRSAREECTEEEEYEMIKIGLKKYASERRWRGFDLVATSYILGLMLNSKTKVVVFLRNKVLAPLFGGLLKQKASFHCGQLKITYDD